MNNETLGVKPFKFSKIIRNPGAFKVGKGITARIREQFDNLNCAYSVSEIAKDIGEADKARQLNKRFAELVSSGYLKKATEKDVLGRTLYIRAESPLVSDYVAG